MNNRQAFDQFGTNKVLIALMLILILNLNEKFFSSHSTCKVNRNPSFDNWIGLTPLILL